MCRLVKEGAVVEGGAVAEGGVFQPAADDLGACDSFTELRKLSFGDLAKPFGRAEIVGRRSEQETDLLEAHAGPPGCLDDGPARARSRSGSGGVR